MVPLPGGGRDYVYQVGSAEVQFPVPPRGFDPLNARAAQLQGYGFQPRPQGGVALTAWDQIMADCKSTPTPSIALGPRMSTPAHQQPVSASVKSGNWAGWLADSSSQEFVATQMNYTQPTTKSTTCSNSKQAVWTGFGTGVVGHAALDPYTKTIFGMELSSLKLFLAYHLVQSCLVVLQSQQYRVKIKGLLLSSDAVILVNLQLLRLP